MNEVISDMKKTFVLKHPKIKKDRLFEAAIYEVKKYMKREERKDVPSGFDYWDFDCRFGKTEEEAKIINKKEIPKYILEGKNEDIDSFYLEILAKPVVRNYKPRPESTK